MNEQEILAAIARLAAEEIGAREVTIGPQTVASDIAGWDSLAHARILAGLESALGIDIDIDRAFALANIGQLVALIREAKGGQN